MTEAGAEDTRVSNMGLISRHFPAHWHTAVDSVLPKLGNLVHGSKLVLESSCCADHQAWHAVQDCISPPKRHVFVTIIFCLLLALLLGYRWAGRWSPSALWSPADQGRLLLQAALPNSTLDKCDANPHQAAALNKHQYLL